MKKKVKSKKGGAGRHEAALKRKKKRQEADSRGALGRGRLSFRSQLLGENKGEDSECVCVCNQSEKGDLLTQITGKFDSCLASGMAGSGR